jgi:glyceraldehyde 3-phosphate dehydrogenase
MATVAINGFGRIGRATFKILRDTADLDVAVINDVVAPEYLAYLLKFDSVYGRYPHEVSHDEDGIIVDDRHYLVTHEKDPADLPWKARGVDIVFECTGLFTQKADLTKHLQAGAGFVILSAPSKSDDVPTVIHGVNHNGDTTFLSCASCTTNCVTPVIEIVDRRIGIRKATMTTIHAYTSSQAIVDAPNKKMRRGRTAGVNIVPTSTGAAIATTRAVPQLKGKFDGLAVRVPVAVGSLADMVMLTTRATSAEEINSIFREEAESERYRGIVGASEQELVSSDIISDSRASIVDLTMTQVVDGDLVKIMSWYDNEWGYASQMVREAVHQSHHLHAPT